MILVKYVSVFLYIVHILVCLFPDGRKRFTSKNQYLQSQEGVEPNLMLQAAGCTSTFGDSQNGLSPATDDQIGRFLHNVAKVLRGTSHRDGREIHISAYTATRFSVVRVSVVRQNLIRQEVSQHAKFITIMQHSWPSSLFTHNMYVHLHTIYLYNIYIILIYLNISIGLKTWNAHTNDVCCYPVCSSQQLVDMIS